VREETAPITNAFFSKIDDFHSFAFVPVEMSW
jgi:hypothetical protein